MTISPESTDDRSEPRSEQSKVCCIATSHIDDCSDSSGQHDPYAVRIGTRPVHPDDRTVAEAQHRLTIHIITPSPPCRRDANTAQVGSYRIIVTATGDAADTHDDIVERRLATKFRDLRIAADGSMWGNTGNVHATAAELAADGWATHIDP